MTSFQSQLDLISKAIELSKKLAAYADEADWSSFLELEKQRIALLENLQLSDVSVSDTEYQQLQQAMSSLMDLNKSLEEKCTGQNKMLCRNYKNCLVPAKA